MHTARLEARCPQRECDRSRCQCAGPPDQRANQLPERATPPPDVGHVGEGDDAHPRDARQQPQGVTGVERQTQRSEQQHLPRSAYLAIRREHPGGEDRPADGERQEAPVQDVAEDEQRHQHRRKWRAAPVRRQRMRRRDPEQRADRERKSPRQERWRDSAAQTQKRVLETVGCPPLYPVRTIRIGQRLAEQPDLRKVLRQVCDRWECDDKKGREREKRRRDEQRPAFSHVETHRVNTESLDVMLSEHSHAGG